MLQVLLSAVVVAGEAVSLKGDLTIRGVTKPVLLTVAYLSTAGEGARQRVGFHVTGKINRMDSGVAWNKVPETGGVMLGDDVDLDISLEAVRAS